VLQRAPFFGQLVLDPDGCFRNDDARDDALGLEFAQALREHPIADVRDPAPKLGKAHPAVQQQLNHGPGPAAPNQLDRPMEPRAQLRLQTHVCILPNTPT